MFDPPALLPPDEEGLSYAAMCLTRGGLVAMPTETVYGLAADARNGRAVAAIYAAKGRPSFNPLIVHAPDIDSAARIGRFHAQAETLARAFWPGPLTLVLPLRADAGISELVTAGLDTVALRLPAHPAARGLLRAFGGVVAAPSANPSGRISPTTPQHVIDGLGDKVDVVLDAGASAVGVESTIIGWQDQNHPVLLRPGGLPREAITAALNGIAPAEPAPIAPDSPTAPGQLSSHYAPRAALRLNARQAEGDEILIGFGLIAGAMSLSASGDLGEAAANLFAMLHRADATGRPIAIAPIPAQGLGLAINDRLRRAAAPRSRA